MGALILACAFAAPALAQGVPAARDLASEARAAAASGVPLVVLFTEPGCPYCVRARRDYLAPLLADPPARGQLRMVEVDVTADGALTGFAGHRTTQAQFAREQQVRFVPTLKFFGADGAEIAPALVGFTVPDFYLGQIERRLEEARERLRGR